MRPPRSRPWTRSPRRASPTTLDAAPRLVLVPGRPLHRVERRLRQGAGPRAEGGRAEAGRHAARHGAAPLDRHREALRRGARVGAGGLPGAQPPRLRPLPAGPLGPGRRGFYSQTLALYPANVEMRPGLAWTLLRQDRSVEARKGVRAGPAGLPRFHQRLGGPRRAGLARRRAPQRSRRFEPPGLSTEASTT